MSIELADPEEGFDVYNHGKRPEILNDFMGHVEYRMTGYGDQWYKIRTNAFSDYDFGKHGVTRIRPLRGV